jgi:hypothetical protein
VGLLCLSSSTYLKLEVFALCLHFGHVKFPTPGNAGTGPKPTVFSAKAGRLNRAPHSGHSINLPRPLLPNKRRTPITAMTTIIAPIKMYKPIGNAHHHTLISLREFQWNNSSKGFRISVTPLIYFHFVKISSLRNVALASTNKITSTAARATLI